MVNARQPFSLKRVLWIALTVLAWPQSEVWGQHREDATMRAALAAFKEIESLRIQGIPKAFLADAHAIAIVPDVVKGSFIVGAKHGKGVLLVRSEDEAWQAPILITLTGGNVGWQVGVQVTDVILVFKSATSVDAALSGKLTLGADAAVAAGPVGRNAEASTDTSLKAEIYSYSRSRGLFAGVALDGSVIRIDSLANSAYYGKADPGQSTELPASAIALVEQVAETTGNVSPSAAGQRPQPQASLARKHTFDEPSDLRNQLARTAPRLYRLLDESWQDFLALPAEVFRGQDHPSEESLRNSLAHFDAVASDPRYRDLASRPEFQSTHGLLRDYARSGLFKDAPVLQLPEPPPKRSRSPQ